MILYGVRHGKTLNQFGKIDLGLSDLGKNQAREVSRRLSRLEVTEIVTSPRRRTLETAIIIGEELGVNIVQNEAFVEVPISGKSPLETRRLVREFFDTRWSDASDSVLAWRNKIIEQIYSLKPSTVLVSHLGVLNVIVGAASNAKYPLSFRPPHCSLSKIHIESKSVIHYESDF